MRSWPTDSPVADRKATIPDPPWKANFPPEVASGDTRTGVPMRTTRCSADRFSMVRVLTRSAIREQAS